MKANILLTGKIKIVYRLITLFALFFTALSFGQEIGDLRSRQDGYWTNASTWEEWNGSNWSNTSTQPGSVFNGNLEIQHNVYIGRLATFWFWTYNVDEEREVTGNLKISAGNLSLTKANRSENIRLLVGEDFTLSGGLLSLYDGTGSGSSVNAGVVVVSGDVFLNGGNIVSNAIRVPSGIYLSGNTIQNFNCNINLSTEILNRFYVKTGHLGINETYGGLNVSTVYGTPDASYQDAQIWPTSGEIIKNFTVNTSGILTMTKSREVNEALYLNNGTLDINEHHLKLNGSTFTKVDGSIKQQNNLGKLEFANQNLITIPNQTFEGSVSNLIISQSGGIKMQDDLYISNELNLNAQNPNTTDGLLDMVISYGDYAQVAYGSVSNFADSTEPFNNLNSYILYMDENAITTGFGDVIGKIKRTSISNNKLYDFGNVNTKIRFNSISENSGLPETVLFTITRGNHGEHIDNLSNETKLFVFDENGEPLTGPRSAIKRMYQIQYTAPESLPSSTLFTLRLAYQADELNGSINADLITWDHHLPYGGITPHEHGKTGNNIEENWVELSNHSVLYLTKEGATTGSGTITKYWMLSERETLSDYVWLGVVDAGLSNWNVLSNWSGGKIPDENANVYIPSTYQYAPVINENSGYGNGIEESPGVILGEVRMRTIEIAPNANLVIEGAPDIYMFGGPNDAGGGINYGTFNILGNVNTSESTVYLMDDSTASEVTLNGNLKFYNLEASLDARIDVMANTSIEILNNFTIPSTTEFNAITNPNTFIFSGTNQIVPNPGNSELGFYNLVLRGENTQLPTQLNLSGSLSINSTNLNFNSTQLIFNGIKEQFIKSDSLTATSVDEVLVNNNSKLTSIVDELSINKLILTDGSFEVDLNKKVIFSDTITRTLGTLGGFGTFEFSGLNKIEDGLFPKNSSTANITINKITTDFQFPAHFTVEGNLHLEKGEVALASNTLAIQGNLTASTGRVNAVNADLIFAGDNTQLIYANALKNNIVKNIEMTGVGTYQLYNNLNLSGILRPSSGILDIDSTLTFKSDENFTAVVAEIGPNADVVGNVRVERYIPAKRAFRFINPTITSSKSIKVNWQEDANAYNHNPNPGYGTHITGTNQQSPNPIGIDGTNGFDWNPSGATSMFYFDNLNQQWKPIENTNQKLLEAGVPYRIMVRGSRAVDITSNNAISDPTVLRSVGTLNKNTYIYSATLTHANESPNLVGNPYQAPIDLSLVFASSTNLSKYVHIWDPTISDQDAAEVTRGAFVSIDVLDQKTSNVDSEANRFLQPGQAAYFYAEDPAYGVEIVFQESHKAVDVQQTQVFNTEFSTPEVAIRLYDKSSYDNQKPSTDAVLIRFSENFESAIDKNDAPKQENTNENLARMDSGKLLSIEQRSIPVNGEILPLFINQYLHDEYYFKMDVSGLDEEIQLYLVDNYLNENILINQQNNTYEFSVDQSINASMAMNRFKLVFENVSLGTESYEADNFSIYPNPVSQNQFQIKSMQLAGTTADLNIFDLVGKLVLSQSIDFNENGIHKVQNLNLDMGVYFVQLRSQAFKMSKKIIVK